METYKYTTKEIGDYRINIYSDMNAQCPCTDWDMVWNFLWEYGCNNSLSESCDWLEVYGKYGNSNHSLNETIIQLIDDYVDWEDLVQYFKDGKINNYRLRNSDDMWLLEWYNSKKDVYEEIEMFEDYEMNENLVTINELLDILVRDELLQILNDLGKDIIAQEWSSSGYSQGDYVEGIAFCTKERFKKIVSENTDKWKEEALEYLDGSVKTVGMWMRGDVKGFTLEQKVRFAKQYEDSEREDEEDFEWEEIDSCWGYYMDTDKLIDEVISEHDLKEKYKLIKL